MYLTETERIGLIPYTHEDDRDLYDCWQDTQTQLGYNHRFHQTFEAFAQTDPGRFRFWVTVIDKETNARVGTLRSGLDEICPDLAIWIYPRYRHMGFGTEAFRLALAYLFERFPYEEIAAGCYCDNARSLQMLRKLGFVRCPSEDTREAHCFTGAETTQLAFRITKDAFLKQETTG